MRERGNRRTRKIVRLFILPLLAIMVIQSFITYGTVSFGGTFDTLRKYSVGRLEQVAETRRITIENNMNRQWSNIDEEYKTAVMLLSDTLQEAGLTLDDFLVDENAKNKFLEELVPKWVYMMRKNGISGAFLFLAPENIEKTGGRINGFYLRDEDPAANAVDYSDISLARGSSLISKDYDIPFDNLWKQKLELKPVGERIADSFFYQPFLAASKHDLEYENLGYWSELFCLENDLKHDSQKMMTYSVPLMTKEGELFGVMGIGISEKQLSESLPYREVNIEQQGGYLLLKKTGENEYRKIFSTGPVVNRNVNEKENLTLVPMTEKNLYSIQGDTPADDLYLTLSPMRVYNTNTPFFDKELVLAGVETYDLLFGFNERLADIFSMAIILSLLVGVVGVYFIVQYVTKPIRRLSECIRVSKENELEAFDLSYIAEVDELYGVLWNLTEQQKKAESNLMQEKERYRVALQSSSDVLISYDMEADVAELYNLDGQGEILQIESLKSKIAEGEFTHPEDKVELLDSLIKAKDELTLNFRSKWFDSDKGYQWYELSGRILQNGEKNGGILIGALRNVHQQKMYEMNMSYRDALTGLFRREYGENLIRNRMKKKQGYLLAMDIRGFLKINEQFGMVVADTVLEEIGRILLTWKEEIGNERVVLLRFGGDEFLAWVEDAKEAEIKNTIDRLHSVISMVYEMEFFPVALAVGVAFCDDGIYDKGRLHSRKALSYSKEKGILSVFFSEIPSDWRGLWIENEGLNVIEHTSAVKLNTVSLTFNFFDKSHDIFGILAVLFPKLGQAYGVSCFIFSQVSRDFFTTQLSYGWPATSFEEKDREIQHYTAAEFGGLESKIWNTVDNYRFTKGLTEKEREFLHIPPQFEGVVFPLFDSGVYMGAICFLRPNGNVLWSESICSEMYEVVKIIENNLNRNRHDLASRAKSDFLSRMSHEIRTPMNAIIGMTMIAEGHKNNPSALEQDLEKISQSSKYLLGLINDILDMSKIESGKMTLIDENFHLPQMIQAIGNLMYPQMEAKGIRYEVDLDISDSWVKGDSLHLNQVLVNLLSNATKFTSKGGTVTLAVNQESNGKCHFSVKDTGIGISPENSTRIFQSFEQAEAGTARQFGGTGLGLAISSKLIRMMNGSIELESEVGKGSHFYFTIILPKGEGKEIAEQEEVDYAVIFNEKRVLLVEDNELNVEISKTLLEMNGFIVEVALNGKIATEMFANSSIRWYDLILMDIHMPIMDGLEATKTIRRMEREDALSVPIIAMTANAFDEDMRKSVESGMNGHLAKPIERELFLATLAESLKSK